MSLSMIQGLNLYILSTNRNNSILLIHPSVLLHRFLVLSFEIAHHHLHLLTHSPHISDLILHKHNDFVFEVLLSLLLLFLQPQLSLLGKTVVLRNPFFNFLESLLLDVSLNNSILFGHTAPEVEKILDIIKSSMVDFCMSRKTFILKV